MSIEPTCLEVIYQKREILTERIWKISAISTVSGVLPIGGSNLTADIDLLRKEIQTYRLQFGITDDVLRASSNCPGKILSKFTIFNNFFITEQNQFNQNMSSNEALESKFCRKRPIFLTF